MTIAINKLTAHPDNPNRMSKAAFAKLVRNIERTGKYEPLVVRPHPEKGESGFFQIVNGHHRWLVLKQLGYKTADAVVWDIDDQQTEIFLATLNRLSGSDVLDKKLQLLKKLTEKMPVTELGKILPQTSKQLERLVNLKLPRVPVSAGLWRVPVVFFVTQRQQEIIEDALSMLLKQPPKAVSNPASPGQGKQTKASRRAEALTAIAQSYLNSYNK